MQNRSKSHEIFGLKLLGEFFEFGDRENRAIDADILGANVTSTAFADAALHAHFQRGDDLLGGEAQVPQGRDGVLDHDGWSANQGNGLVRGGGYLGNDSGDDAGVVGPGVVGIVDGEVDVDIRTLSP